MALLRTQPCLIALTLLTSGFIAGTAWAGGPVATIKDYLGRWDVTLQTPDRNYASWLEITERKGGIQARMVGRWGHARILPHAEIANGHIRLVSPKEEEGRTDGDMIFEGRIRGYQMVGTTSGPDGTQWNWRAERAPSLERKNPPKWGAPVALFNGKDLAGWHLSEAANTPAWEIKQGKLISPGRGADLVSDRRFGDFKLHVEFNCGRGANSGVYLRGRYEVQIEDDPSPDAPERSMGGVYGFLAPSHPVDCQPGKWRTYDITLIGRRVTVILDGATLIDNREIPGLTGGALDSHEGLPGPIYLQGGEDGRVEFRNIVVTPSLAPTG